MTNNREDYLKTIFRLHESGEKATNKKISMHLNIAPASVSEMLKKLLSEGFIIFNGTEICLTEEGVKESKRVLSCHRLWETFLLEKLHYNWQDVHEQADLLEHVTNDELKKHLNVYLNYPKNCPHGSIIYENMDGPVEESLFLADLEVGQKAMIIKVDDDEKQFLAYLDRIGLELHDELEILERDSFDDSLLVLCKGKKISISIKAMRHIYVKVLDK
ncbi:MULTISPECIES: metal-dependent transcriptional regulator [Terrabacteria group]|uniref:metal-dependent transcriptional regulator n=1 Tax=Bacillati TaxID=1783272 RepID=UPI00193A13B6|nr:MULTISPECIES: metal-dependent transcriptional regulator [Terrabacteria group]MBW9212652.1 metal-dependent transcriptional regulator [Trueperella sp. zg.1013]QRG86861.1 metal-dependent transcriptional regulator [Bulleidia sp. zg-1006]